MNKELNYLLDLMDDPSDEVFRAIEEKFLKFGKPVARELESYWEKSGNLLVQSRIENLLQKINLQFLKKQIKSWIDNSDFNLIYGSYLLTLFQYPDYEFKDINSRFEELKRDLWLEMNPQLTALEKVRVLNHVVFQVHKFQGSRSNPTSPQHFFINNLLDTKRGNQFSMALLYASLAQSIEMPVYGVQLPNNYLLAYHDQKLARYAGQEQSGVLFYINPYNNGAIFGQEELSKMLKKNKIETRKQYFQPADNVSFINEVFKALLLTFQGLGYTDKVVRIEELQRFITSEQSRHIKRNKNN
jgi:regulator of sirC expression with transglutaminase-like and TPR domain